ncbi:MAG: glycosyltransferase [Melioribacteraceae bacterium]|nr:glycosyltransferase [Melioribacteraceae bacterium]MCF8355568.1 glycosyltransferase [Melioribacteraceae bacterium]MCF8394243.1 glycosyltransferase [Melioribacteraceae bacterium]MCF8419964.1 glycosyltransferase [Melioribacteraceae bacterium]
MPQKRLHFSVIVPTFNRSGELKELLDSLINQTFPKDEFEVLIVDDGSTDNTEELITSFQNDTSLNLTFLKQDHKGPGTARNYGMNEANGNYFVFIDSDCIADENWLTAFYKATKDLIAAGFGGPDKVLPDFSPVQKAIDYSMTSFITTGGIRGHSNKKISKYYPRSFNMGVRADVVQKIGGMGKLRHGQDIEFSHRILSTGEPVIKVSDAVVYHKRRTSIKKFFRQVFNWGVARINLYKIDSGMLEPVHFLPSIGTLISLFIILLTFFFPSIFIWLIIAGIIILIMMGLHGTIKYKDIRTFLFIPVIVPTQIFGYGLGFIIAYIRRVILKQDEFTGFVKKYYK